MNIHRYSLLIHQTILEYVIDIQCFLNYIQNNYSADNLYSRLYQLVSGLYLYCMLRLFEYGTFERLHSVTFTVFIGTHLY